MRRIRNRVLFIGTDNFRAGQDSGKRMATLLGGQGRVVIITLVGQSQQRGTRARGERSAEEISWRQIVQTIDDKGDPRVAYDAISALVQKKEKIDGIICLEASGGAGAADALHRLDMTGKIKIVAFDKDPQTLDGIDRKWITATVVQKPYVMAFYGVSFLDDLHHNVVHEFQGLGHRACGSAANIRGYRNSGDRLHQPGGLPEGSLGTPETSSINR